MKWNEAEFMILYYKYFSLNYLQPHEKARDICPKIAYGFMMLFKYKGIK